MAKHQSSEKRIRQTATRNARNRYYAKTTRNAVKKLRNTTEKAVAEMCIRDRYKDYFPFELLRV